MKPLNVKNPGAGRRSGAEDFVPKPDTGSVPQHVAASKLFAVWRYCIGTRSLQDTQEQFDRRPLWRSA
jgi:hypothetical protein